MMRRFAAFRSHAAAPCRAEPRGIAGASIPLRFDPQAALSEVLGVRGRSHVQ
jgi:hypothetical protein